MMADGTRHTGKHNQPPEKMPERAPEDMPDRMSERFSNNIIIDIISWRGSLEAKSINMFMKALRFDI